ncbi:MAG TPA: AsmA family protein [Bryobacteraceae bacterium]|nr:AsmA family protein [Bryobacteraceae bacterium]
MKRALRIAGIIIALLVVILIALPFLIDANDFRPMLETKLSQTLAREVKVGNLKLALLAGGVTADDLSIAEDPAYGRTPFVQAKSFSLAVDLPSLVFSHKLAVSGLTIDQPQIVLMQSPAGDWNFSSLGTKSAARPAPVPAPESSAAKSNLDLSVKLVKITDGRFTMGHTGSHLKPLVLEKVNAELHDFARGSVFPFSLSMNVVGGGTIKLTGKAGPIDENDAAMTPASLTLNVAQLDLAGSGLNETAPSVSGLISFDGSGESTGKSIDLKGKLRGEKLRLSASGTPAKRALELDFAVTHDLRKRSGTVHRGDIHVGGAVASLTGTYAPQGESTLLNMNLSGPEMPLVELAEMLPAMGVVLPMGSSLQSGTAAVKLSMQGVVERLVTTGSVGLNNAKLAGFDLPKKMSTIEKLAGIKGGPDTEIQELSSNVRVAPEGMSADEIKLIVPSIGNLEGAGTISPANVLAFKMRATVHTGGVAAVVRDTPIPFTVEGTCSEPAFRPDIGAVVKEEAKGLEKGVGKAAGDLFKGLLGKKK